MDTGRDGILSGVRVVELSGGIPAAYCGRQFAQWGADVVVLEPEGGSPLRRRSPRARDDKGAERSLLWEYLAANKRALRRPDGADRKQRLLDLLQRTDILIVDGEAPLAEAGLGFSELRSALPGLVVLAITDFGLSGPYRAYAGSDLVHQSLGGYLTINGEPDKAPLRVPAHLGSTIVGANAFVGALAALIKRRRTGGGGLVEISAVETFAAIGIFMRAQYAGEDVPRVGGPHSGVRFFPCKDGWVNFLPMAPHEHARIREVLEIPDEEWPEGILEGDRAEALARIHGFLSRYTLRKTAREVFDGLEERGLACGMLIAPAELLEQEQLVARGVFRDLDVAGLGRLRYPIGAARMTQGGPVPVRQAPAGAEPLDVGRLGWDVRPKGRISEELPLAGLKVVDLTQAWIGPYCTLQLADLGADVVKVESPTRPDIWRSTPPLPTPGLPHATATPWNRAFNFNSMGRSKRSMGIDLKSDKGRELILRLVEDADVVAENYTPLVMTRFGLGHDELKKRKADIVMVSASGFGKTGPWSDLKSNGSAIEALAGWDWLHRYPGGPPLVMGTYQPDPICGLAMTATVLLGLYHRDATGQGGAADFAMLETSVSLIGELLMAADLGIAVEGAGNRAWDFSPNGLFRCRGADSWIAISIETDAQWKAFCSMEGLPDALRRQAFASAAGRLAEEDRLEALITSWTEGWDTDELMAALQAKGVPAGAVRNLWDCLDDSQLEARGFFLRLHRDDLGTQKYNGYSWRFDGLALKPATPPPHLGEHNAEILKERLGMSDAEIAALREAKVIGEVP